MAKPPFPFFRFPVLDSHVTHNAPTHSAVIPALGAGIHALGAAPKAWIPEPSSGMTIQFGSNQGASR